ncbi:hypothetical protein FM115_03940 [Marinilactibacillus psychrotolerans 42ea]|uniref:Uncharacterized protein n=1 Tax=Marinilactibacillus psychrotolerans 42ea TaxID=1255609 RepID=A0A1R4J5F0_9LACT|nr:hypothetical protein FM115_03940 [Marinilactibacillus psychrotolerans 42ea]
MEDLIVNFILFKSLKKLSIKFTLKKSIPLNDSMGYFFD